MAVFIYYQFLSLAAAAAAASCCQLTLAYLVKRPGWPDILFDR